jgi:hypothetical protein
MKPWLKNLWVPVGLVWATVVILTLWNFQKIDSILAAQAQARILQTEYTFQKQNSHKLDRVWDDHSKLILPVDSIHLGVLYVKSVFSDLCNALELSGMKMTVAPIQKESESILLNLAFTGSFETIMRFLSALDAHRYLQDRQLVIKSDPVKGETYCELSLSLRCKVKAREVEPEIPKRNSAL